MEKAIKEIIIDNIDKCPFSDYNTFGKNYCKHKYGPNFCALVDCPFQNNDYLIKLSPALSEGDKNEK